MKPSAPHFLLRAGFWWWCFFSMSPPPAPAQAFLERACLWIFHNLQDFPALAALEPTHDSHPRHICPGKCVLCPKCSLKSRVQPLGLTAKILCIEREKNAPPTPATHRHFVLGAAPDAHPSLGTSRGDSASRSLRNVSPKGQEAEAMWADHRQGLGTEQP